MDLIERYGELAFSLDFYTDGGDLRLLADVINQARRALPLRIHAMRCCHTLVPHDAAVECCRGMLPYDSAARCCTMLPHDAVRCCRATLPYDATARCSRTMLPYDAVRCCCMMPCGGAILSDAAVRRRH